MLRGLIKTKGYSLLNILGLTIGITSASLILLWVEDELNYDSIYPNRNYIYKVPTNQGFNDKIYTFNSTPGKLVPTIKKDVPGVKYASRFSDANRLMSVNDKALYKQGAYVDLDFFNMFSVNFVQGSLENLRSDVNSIALTQETAIQLFGKEENVIGKSILVNNKTSHIIGAVMADLPDNVSIKYDWLGNFKAFEVGKEFLKMWGSNSTSSYLQLSENANMDEANKLIQKIIPQNSGNDNVYAFLDSMKDWHLYQYEKGVKVAGRIFYVRVMSIIAFIILLIACINFMNLATARSSKRASEVGIRKALGSKRRQLIAQFIIEALIITTVAALLSLLLLYLLLPYFNTIIDKELTIGLSNPIHLTALLGVILSCGLLAGSYPAFYLSSFNPTVVLKGGRTKKGRATFIRNGLVVMQFSASIILIIATIIIYSQIQYVKNRDLGFNKSNLLTISLQGEAAKKISIIKKEMLDSRMVSDVGTINYNLMHGGWNGWGLEWQGKPEDFNPLISFREVDADFIKTVGIELLEGRNFYENPIQDGYGDSLANNYKVIITESLAKMMGKESAIGKIVRNDDGASEIVGVVKDLQYGSMYKKSIPVLFYNIPQNARLLYARLNHNVPTEKALSALRSVMKKHCSDFPFEYKFVQDTFSAKFKSEKLYEQLAKWFAIITILISCLGLFGLATYTAEQRNKEIGVRKVMGASITSVVNLLSVDFLKLVGIAILIAIPAAFLLMQNWLQNYSYRVRMSWWMFGIAALLAIAIAVFTISFQALKAARTNPAKSLKSE